MRIGFPRRFAYIANYRSRKPAWTAPTLGHLQERMRPLTDRELAVLGMVADGYQNKEIARKLQLAEETVKSHVARILRSLDARNRAHAVSVGHRRGLIGSA